MSDMGVEGLDEEDEDEDEEDEEEDDDEQEEEERDEEVPLPMKFGMSRGLLRDMDGESEMCGPCMLRADGLDGEEMDGDEEDEDTDS